MYISCLDTSLNFTDVAQTVPLKLCVMITSIKLYTFVPALFNLKKKKKLRNEFDPFLKTPKELRNGNWVLTSSQPWRETL